MHVGIWCRCRPSDRIYGSIMIEDKVRGYCCGPPGLTPCSSCPSFFRGFLVPRSEILQVPKYLLALHVWLDAGPCTFDVLLALSSWQIIFQDLSYESSPLGVFSELFLLRSKKRRSREARLSLRLGAARSRTCTLFSLQDRPTGRQPSTRAAIVSP